MALQVRFIDDPETHLVRKIVQSWVVQLMGSTDSIDIVALHDEKVFLHEIIRHRATTSGVMLMTVNSAEDDSLAVDFDQAVLHLDLSKTDALGDNLITGRDDEMI